MEENFNDNENEYEYSVLETDFNKIPSYETQLLFNDEIYGCFTKRGD